VTRYNDRCSNKQTLNTDSYVSCDRVSIFIHFHFEAALGYKFVVICRVDFIVRRYRPTVGGKL